MAIQFLFYFTNYIASKILQFGGFDLTNLFAQELKKKSNPSVNLDVSDVERPERAVCMLHRATEDDQCLPLEQQRSHIFCIEGDELCTSLCLQSQNC